MVIPLQVELGVGVATAEMEVFLIARTRVKGADQETVTRAPTGAVERMGIQVRKRTCLPFRLLQKNSRRD